MPILYLTHRLLQSPLESLFTLLIFIFAKDLHATPLQLTLLAAAKSLVSLIAFPTNTLLARYSFLKKPFLITSCCLSSALCILFPSIENPWFYLFSYAFFLTTVKVSTSVWVDCLKKVAHFGRYVSLAGAINYTLIIGVPLMAAYFMDHDAQLWKKLFFLMGLLQLFSLIPLILLKVDREFLVKNTEANKLNSREDLPFFQYQLLYFLGGVGLIAIQPVIPLYFSNELAISYLEIVTAISLCRGLAFVISTPFWIRFLERTSIYQLSVVFNFFGVPFILFLLLAKMDHAWLFLAYLFYGAMQSGGDLTWNLSGPYFAKEKESLTYSGINHLFVGLRGIIAPIAGQCLFLYSGFIPLFVLTGSLSLVSSLYAFKLENRRKLIEISA